MSRETGGPPPEETGTNKDQKDTRLSLEDAQEEGRSVRIKAVNTKAKKNLTGGFMGDREFKEYISDLYGAEKFKDEKDRIYSGMKEQPSKADYDRASEEVELEKVRDKLKKLENIKD